MVSKDETMNTDLSEIYQIKVCGKLDAHWSDWFGGLAIAHEIANNDLPVTILTGPVIDQAALYGILWQLRDLNLRLISVTPIASAEEIKGANQTGLCPL